MGWSLGIHLMAMRPICRAMNHGNGQWCDLLSTDRHEQSNKAYSFDGVDDQIIVANHSSLNFAKAISALLVDKIYRFR